MNLLAIIENQCQQSFMLHVRKMSLNKKKPITPREYIAMQMSEYKAFENGYMLFSKINFSHLIINYIKQKCLLF